MMLEPNEARVVLNNKRLLVILLDEQPKEHVALENWAKVLLEENPLREVDIFVIAPTVEVDQTLAQTDFQVPWTTRLAIITVNEAGVPHEITANQADGFDRHVLQTCAGNTASLVSMQQDIKSIVEAHNKHAGEVVNFQQKLQGDSAFATHALLAVIVAFYFIQVILGADTYAPGLVRMGADSAQLVGQGQYWRLFTSIFLHAGFLHIAMNGYVLYALGSFFNKLIGNARFLTLFFLSGAAGSAASVFISGSPLSVGASGALWGLFGLSGALILKPSHFLPDSIRYNLRNITLINLAINIGFSFAVPMIDKWAHFGGGVAGFLIGLAFVYEPTYRGRNLLHVVLATVMSSIAVLSVAANLYFEQPWILTRPPEHTNRVVFNGEIGVAVPSFLKLTSETKSEAIFGDINFEPYVIVVMRQKLNITSDQLRADLEKEISTPIKEKVVDGTTIFSTYIEDKKKHLLNWRWWMLRGGAVVLVEIAAQEGIPKALIDNLDRIIESVHSPIRI